MTADGRPRLFLSSTKKDLDKFRDVVAPVCQRIGIDLIAMEHFGVDPRNAADLCQAKIAEVDLFLGLYAHRYGFKPPGFDGTSFIELEYQWAAERVPPPILLIFIVDENQEWRPTWIDHGEDWDRLQDFKNRLRTKHVIGRLTTPEWLRGDLFEHLPQHRDVILAAAPLPEPYLPRPSETYAAYQYDLLATRVVGREAELTYLDEWARDSRAARVLSIVGIGGMGKSALSWRWFHDRAASAISPLAGRLWWSFYEPDADFERFVSAALAYCGEHSLEAVAQLTPTERERRLLAILDRLPYLLVLDGIQYLLGAYTRPEFAHLRDEDVDRLTTAGHVPGRQRLSETTDHRAGEFLRKLTSLSRTRTLLTTRLQPSALQTSTGANLPGSAQWRMPPMGFEDAAALWHDLNCSGSQNGMQELFERIDYDPLLIRLLAGAVSNFRQEPGNLDSWMRSNPLSNAFGLPPARAKSHVFSSALDGLSDNARLLLLSIASFRPAIEYPTLEDLFVRRLGWSLPDLDGGLQHLESRGILGWNRESNSYNVNTVVRGVVWADSEANPALNAARSERARDTYVELMSLLFRRAQYTMAAQLYVSQLGGGTFALTEGGHVDTEIRLLEGLFPSGPGHDPAVEEHDAQGFIAWLGHAYEAAGRLLDAVKSADHCVTRLGVDASVPEFLIRYLSERLRIAGRLERSLEVAGHAEGSGNGLQHLLCMATIGERDQVRDVLARRRASRTPAQRTDVQIHLVIEDFGNVIEVGESLLRGGDLWILDRLNTAIDVLEARFRTGEDLDVAKALSEVMSEARTKKLAEPYLHGLRVLAEVYRIQGMNDESIATLTELRRHPAVRYYRLICADAANTWARLPHANPTARINAARIALRLAECAKPPFAYRPAADTARATLAELGVNLEERR